MISKDRVLRKEYSHRNDATRFIRSRITTMSPASRPTIAGTPTTAQLSSWLFTSWWPCLLFLHFHDPLLHLRHSGTLEQHEDCCCNDKTY
ncbi:hypothetical protein CEXT_765111 [Caerostris extrusa]|uniref:Uncharacterized protein n=1 Tax=Caerostris extrusa TaxID=172846 RepID=A0AAV4TZU8_CAEEX|nr:hypothetical protein CEXT_765111 [Caerostris extrusa]